MLITVCDICGKRLPDRCSCKECQKAKDMAEVCMDCADKIEKLRELGYFKEEK